MAKKKSTAIVKATEAVRAVATVDPQTLLARAIDKNLPIEQMERLLTMRREMKMEWARETYFQDLAQFQAECPIVEKKHKVMDRDKQTRETKGERYSYAALEDLVATAGPYLMKWGFSYTFKSQQDKDTVTGICHAHHKNGHEEVNCFQVPIDHDAYMSDPQKAAAALTFATRYAFKNAFGIQTKGEDRDENLGTEERRAPIQQPQAKPAQPASLAPKTDYDKVLLYIQATEVDPTTKQVVKLFTENEQIDYRHEAKENKGNPEELAKILKDIIDTGHKRRMTVQGV